MKVNSLYNGRVLQVFGAIVICVCIIFLSAAFMTDKSGAAQLSKRANIAVRAIGHQLLLRAGDSTSVVGPVVEKSNGVFLLAFENELVFQPDTLVAIVQQVLEKTNLSRYTVTVHQCDRPAIVYGFEINPPGNNIQSCSGRVQPKDCYTLEIAFAEFPTEASLPAWMIIMLSGLTSAVAVFVIGRNFKLKTTKAGEPKQIIVTKPSWSTNVMIGKLVFDRAEQCLRTDNETIALTDKECKILALLNANLGQLTLRDDLIQAVWTDEGVITGRSLDMFISKLRKKLSADSELRIANVHGKGYRLERIV